MGEYKILLFTKPSRLALRPTRPPIQCVPCVLFLGVKWPGHKADHLPASSAEVENEWSYVSTPYKLHGVDRNYFTVDIDRVREE
jgi:hypothetical protein